MYAYAMEIDLFHHARLAASAASEAQGQPCSTSRLASVTEAVLGARHSGTHAGVQRCMLSASSAPQLRWRARRSVFAGIDTLTRVGAVGSLPVQLAISADRSAVRRRRRRPRSLQHARTAPLLRMNYTPSGIDSAVQFSGAGAPTHARTAPPLRMDCTPSGTDSAVPFGGGGAPTQPATQTNCSPAAHGLHAIGHRQRSAVRRRRGRAAAHVSPLHCVGRMHEKPASDPPCRAGGATAPALTSNGQVHAAGFGVRVLLATEDRNGYETRIVRCVHPGHITTSRGRRTPTTAARALHNEPEKTSPKLGKASATLGHDSCTPRAAHRPFVTWHREKYFYATNMVRDLENVSARTMDYENQIRLALFFSHILGKMKCREDGPDCPERMAGRGGGKPMERVGYRAARWECIGDAFYGESWWWKTRIVTFVTSGNASEGLGKTSETVANTKFVFAGSFHELLDNSE
ncbi:hypothetical protein B0H12DRAFT_1293261 [Mycena haematopus]|nr:hypothetical protein B0H12DRAFT_1293261 [Mycena haematopus]